MASLYVDKGRWRVDEWYRDSEGARRRRRRRFKSEAEARAYVDAEGLTVGVPSGGYPARTAEEMIQHLATHSALTDAGCVVWIGGVAETGYGNMRWAPTRGAPVVAGVHRVAAHLLIAPVPEDKVVDHLCRNRACIRPDHLEIVTQRENVLRSPFSLVAINTAKTHCPQGHPYSPENTYVYTSATRRANRHCRTCNREQARVSYLRKKASA